MSIFTGAGLALITPMHEDGTINYDEMERIVNDQIEGGTDAIIVCGTTGESSTMTHEEHIETIRACVQMVKKRIPVIAGSGSNCTETAVYLSKEAEKAGADGLLVVSPYYNKATQNGLKKHFTEIAGSVDIPLLLYNIQGRTGVNIAPQTIADLVKEVDNIVGVKEASGDLSQVASIFSLTQGDIDVYSGNDDQIIPIVALGGKGVISVLSHVAPKETHDMVIKLLEGDVETAKDLQIKYIPLVHALFSEVNPIPVKAAMNMMGYQAGPLRMPLTEMEEEHKKLLRQEMIKVGIKCVD
ncbi:MAG: 4-hydroxy-tetrahydrodipicolinate synthase [Lachnospiraceae bacterium]|nr:4-hydroxy-tetrahydrodipicolinate synthase [Lachnospiraceae bacterium]